MLNYFYSFLRLIPVVTSFHKRYVEIPWGVGLCFAWGTNLKPYYLDLIILGFSAELGKYSSISFFVVSVAFLATPYLYDLVDKIAILATINFKEHWSSFNKVYTS